MSRLSPTTGPLFFFQYPYSVFHCSSEEVEEKLENERDQIYSPVKNHPFFQKQLPPPRDPILPKQSPLRQPPIPSTEQQKLEQQRQQQQQLSLLKHQQQFSEKLASISAPSIVPKPPPQLAIMKECDIEKFAQDNLNLHSKGIFRKKSSIRDMLSWTPDTITRPMLALSRDKTHKKMATELFKLVQIYMGDRKARDGMTLNTVAIDIITMALSQPPLRDELYVQLCRQTTENHMRESLIRGWELLTICLSFLPPSPTFQPALLK